MIVNLAPAFTDSNTGLSIWHTPQGYQVSVRKANGAFWVVIDEDLQKALAKALGKDDLEDLL